jgi:uncharacterized protein (TIGR03066 family)
MKLVWTAAAACLTLALIGTAGGQDKKGIDKAKLIGIWEVVKSEGAPPGATVEFTKDGKLILKAKVGDKDFNLEGTYKLEGDKIHSVLKIMDKELKDTSTIKTLSDTQLIVVDEKGKVDEFKRKK